MRRLQICLLMVLFTLGVPKLVHADAYQVNATVPYDITSIPPVIVSPVAGTSFDVALVSVSGTCQIVAPASIVSVWRSGLSIGSTMCFGSGEFTLNVPLDIGANILLPRLSNLNNVFGPDGSAVTLTYNPPPQQIPPVIPQPNGSDSIPLSLSTSSPVVIMSDDTNSVTIEITATGGVTPYVIEINWGDGTTDTKSLPSPGRYTFTHTYDKPNVYTIKAHLTDVLGATTEYVLPAVTTRADINIPSFPKSLTSSATQKSGLSWTPFIIAFIAVGSLTAAFWLGELYALQRLQIRRKRVRAKTKSRRR